MKKIRIALLMMVLASISAESYAMLSSLEIRREARFLSDRMRYELNLSVRQFDDVYEINYDFLWNVNEILDDMAYGYDDAIDYSTICLTSATRTSRTSFVAVSTSASSVRNISIVLSIIQAAT